jgi:hypothetical protein
VIGVASGAVVTEQLSMPHSPRWDDNRLWVRPRRGRLDLRSVNRPATALGAAFAIRRRAQVVAAHS